MRKLQTSIRLRTDLVDRMDKEIIRINSCFDDEDYPSSRKFMNRSAFINAVLQFYFDRHKYGAVERVPLSFDLQPEAYLKEKNTK